MTTPACCCCTPPPSSTMTEIERCWMAGAGFVMSVGLIGAPAADLARGTVRGLCRRHTEMLARVLDGIEGAARGERARAEGGCVVIAFAVGRFVEPGFPRGGWRLVHRTLGLCRACLQPREADSKNFCGCHRAKHAAASNAWCKRHPEHHRARVAAWRGRNRQPSGV